MVYPPILLLLLAVSLWAGWSGGSGGYPAAAWAGESGRAPWLLAAGDLRGEIKPCGCSPEGQMGGLPRRLTYLARYFENGNDTALLVDLGNNFPPPSPQGKLKVGLIQELLGRFPPEAILPGPNELAYGLSSLDRALPYMLSNDGIGKAFLPHRTVERGGLRIGIYGFLSPKVVYQGSQTHFRLRPVGPELLRSLGAAKAALGHELTVLLFRGGDAELEVFVNSRLFDRIVAGNPFADELKQVVKREAGGVTVPQVPTKGQGLVRTALIAAPATFSVDWLTETYPDHPDAKRPFEAYDDKVKALFFARMETLEKQKAESPFLGVETCRACHAKPAERWAGSRHAGAITTLEKVGKQFDPECLACHVVGLNRGGYISQDLTPQLAGVQCENCHGPGRAHSLNPKANRTGFDPARSGGRRARVNEATCRNCHVGSHSPTFAFRSYWPKIKH